MGNTYAHRTYARRTYARRTYAEVWEEFAQTKIDNHPDKKWDEIEYWVPMRLFNINFLVFERKDLR